MKWETDSSTSSSSSRKFDKDRHVLFLQMMYQLLPSYYQDQEINRLTLAYFVISGLDILGALDLVDKDAVASWVLSLQVHPRNKDDLNTGKFYGFHGSRASHFPPDNDNGVAHNNSHLASTYCALAILKTIGYKLSDINSESILASMKNLQLPDGCFMPIHTGAEADLRFVYCAATICFMLENWSGIDKEKAKEYILSCQSYDGGFGLTPGSESHGGATYCAVASLRLMGFIEDDLISNSLESSIIDVPLLIDWMLQRQGADGGFQGRPNKASDTCYAFWIGAVLRILGGNKFVDENALRKFLLTCQSELYKASLLRRRRLFNVYFCLAGRLEMAVVKGGYWFPDSGISVSDINSSLFTHLFCAFSEIDPHTYHLNISPSNLNQFSTFAQTVQQKNPSVKSLLSIGGGGATEAQRLQIKATFSSMARQSNARSSFIDSSIKLARSYNFHGLDLDWEYPDNPTDMTNFGVLINEWRAAASRESTATRKPPLLLTAAVYYSSKYESNNYPIRPIQNSLDWVNLMAYDFYDPGWSADMTGPPAALFNPRKPQVSGDAGVTCWVQSGLGANKLVMGMPFYGKAWRLVNANNNGLFAPANGGEGNKQYNRVVSDCVNQRGAQVVYDPTYVTHLCHQLLPHWDNMDWL